MQRLEKLRNWFAGLSKVDKTFLIALLLRVVYALLETATGSEFPASGLIRFFFIVAALIFLFRSVPRLLRKLLWRVRHRLLVTWFLVGVVPIVLICALLTEGLFFLMGQVVGYMTATEISRQNELVRGTAQSLAWSLTHRSPAVDARTLAESFVRDSSQTRQAEVGAIVRTAKETFTVPSNGGIQEIPKWSTPDFTGLTRGNGRYYFGAHVTQEDPTNKTEVFLYQHISTEYFKNLLPDVAVVEMARGEARAG
jgi:sigma-B regulation protein RsbU (phosphoserine phosphatase)